MNWNRRKTAALGRFTRTLAMNDTLRRHELMGSSYKSSLGGVVTVTKLTESRDTNLSRSLRGLSTRRIQSSLESIRTTEQFRLQAASSRLRSRSSLHPRCLWSTHFVVRTARSASQLASSALASGLSSSHVHPSHPTFYTTRGVSRKKERVQ
jgi:hypothetical protein